MKKTVLSLSLIAAISMTGCANNPLNIQNSQDGGVKGALTGAAAGVGVAFLTGKNPIAGALIGGTAGYVIGHHYGLSIEEARQTAAQIEHDTHYRVAVYQGTENIKQNDGSYQRVSYLRSMSVAVPKKAIAHHNPQAEHTLEKIGAVSAKTNKRQVLVYGNKKDFSYVQASLQAGSQQPLSIAYAGQSRGHDARIVLENGYMVASR